MLEKHGYYFFLAGASFKWIILWAYVQTQHRAYTLESRENSVEASLMKWH